MARPPEGGKPRETTMSFRITPEFRDQIQSIRRTAGDRSNSTYVRRLIQEDIERNQRKKTA